MKAEYLTVTVGKFIFRVKVGCLVDLKPDTWPAPGLLAAGAYLALMTAQAQDEAAE